LSEDGKVFDAAGEFRSDLKLDEIDVPENVRLIISRRLERLDENEKRVLAAAGVIGRSFSFQLLAAVCDVDVDELFTVIEKAQQMGIIVPSSKALSAEVLGELIEALIFGESYQEGIEIARRWLARVARCVFSTVEPGLACTEGMSRR
jgi:hypothetical protein